MSDPAVLANQPAQAAEPWHALSPGSAAERLETSASNGLTSEDAARRLSENGPNALEAEAGTSLGRLILEQVANPMVYLLAAAAVVSLVAKGPFDAGVIALIVVANVIIGVSQEYRAESALDALKRLSSPRARVLRDGDVRVIDATEVVVGDVLVIETGDRVAADARLLTESDLRIDESALTGESEPIEKELAELPADTVLADRTCLVFSSTPVVAGRATAVVTATGMSTIVGEIAGEVRATGRQETPLQRRLARLSTRLGILSVVAATVIFALGVARGEAVIDMLLFAVAAAVSAIPEGLPTAVSVSLALGVQRMAKRRALVRRIAAVETLGGCTVVCTDKTGTLTRNEMTVTRLWAGGERFDVTGDGYAPEGEIVPDPGQTEVVWSDVELLLEVGCTANNALLEEDEAGQWRIEGNPTDGAVLVAASKGGMRPSGARCDASRIDEIPFSSSFKYMATLDGREGGGRRLHVKGAPDRVLGYCDRMLLDGRVVELTEELRTAVRQAQADFAADALRVIAAAYREMPTGATKAERADAEHGCIFAGLWGLMDPPRAEAAQAVAAAQRAGIAVKMITGDHVLTGSAIAKRVGILPEDAPESAVITGVELDQLDDSALKKRVREIAVFSRVEPRHKMRIVEALQQLGEVVSMTGDGVNDAPALKRADIGVAMGITGTEVSKEAADMVLADDDFATIVSAVEEGRVIYGNLQRVVAFLVMVALGQVMAIAASLVLGWPLPITPVMVLWANLVVASTLTIPLGIEPKHDNVLAEPPRDPAADIVDRRASWRIGTGAVLKAVGMLAVFGYYLQDSSVVHAQTMAFTTLVAFEWAQAIGCRSWNVPLTKLGVFTNRSLVVGLLAGLALQWVAVSSPATDLIIGTDPLGPAEWGIAIAVGATGLLLSAIMTWIESRKRRA
ncbi:MAG: HAD-IC family P-type ATPase [Coriobacteriia bacterium]|nr:HAD-IC family P-type ATPase [Coriobacteriia bacterium]